MTTLALLLVFPLAWPIVAKLIWKHEITLGELAINVAIGVLVVTAGWALGRYAQMHDVEILNGQVTGKYSERVSCEHSYSCNCRESCTTRSDGSRSCSTTCSTCYEHSYDVDWKLRTTLSDIEIDRVNRQGTQEPPRYSRAQVGDPVAQSHFYQNYIKAAPDSLFNAVAEKQALAQFKDKVPAYPSTVYDYHYVNRVIPVGVAVPELSAWNQDLANSLRVLGPSKQVNVVVVMTAESDPQFATALNAAWLGGKKNDVVVVLGTPRFPDLAWARVLSWTDKEVFKVQLRDALLDLKTVQRETVLPTVVKHIEQGFKRRPMADFEYLAHQVEPPGWAVVLLLVLSVAASVGASVYLARNMTSTSGPRSRLGRYKFR